MIQIQNSHHSDYEQLGGAEQLRLLVDRFYDLMHEFPETRGVRELHPDDLTGSRQKLFDFLSGWLGHRCSWKSTAHRCFAHTAYYFISAPMNTTKGYCACVQR